jgi:hypothetical protein
MTEKDNNLEAVFNEVIGETIRQIELLQEIPPLSA